MFAICASKEGFCSYANSLSQQADGFSWIWLKDEMARQEAEKQQRRLGGSRGKAELC